MSNESQTMSQSFDQSLAELKTAALTAIRTAEKAAYDYACACDVGAERERAFDVYERIRTSTRFI